jgi:hypothetical protein
MMVSLGFATAALAVTAMAASNIANRLETMVHHTRVAKKTKIRLE